MNRLSSIIRYKLKGYNPTIYILLLILSTYTIKATFNVWALEYPIINMGYQNSFFSGGFIENHIIYLLVSLVLAFIIITFNKSLLNHWIVAAPIMLLELIRIKDFYWPWLLYIARQSLPVLLMLGGIFIIIVIIGLLIGLDDNIHTIYIFHWW